VRPVHIVYVSAGNGHRMAARALRESFDHRAVPNIIMDILDFSSDLFKWSYSDVYDELTDKNREASVALRLFEKISTENVKKFMRYIAENEPKKCICTHYFPLNVLSRMKEEGLYRGEIYTVITDFGLRRMWVKDSVDKYFISGDRVLRGLLELGVPSEKIAMTGIPVSRKYSVLQRKGRDFQENKLSILFVASSIPNALALEILAALSRTGLPLDVTVVTGRNRDLLTDLESTVFGETLSLRILGFVDNLEVLMSGASLLITKPGGLTVSEALCAAIPMILVNPIPKQETNNSAYLQEKGAGILASTASDVEREQAAAAIAFPTAADDVAEIVLEGKKGAKK